ncbi:TonB-dependent receptor [Erythrobacter litoralis]|uniref:TonB-dependent receptor domain-containing protein n=1 Tax=Erythrobacter litoralis TaxID=39960 RepID=UPI002435C4F0|nr:TonB-dependent receptor [Erythrobacter litoralis]MDG6078844.1 TonB-dependent receptor [Erythrobacter litoralis]
MNRKTRYLLGATLSVSALSLAAGASAQTAPAADEDLQPDLAEQIESEPEDTIIVTGSYIRGQREDGAQPVDVFGQEELESRGIDSPLEFIKSLPSVGPVLGDSNQYGAGGSQGVGSINLRSLGRERTLVLFNGRRFATEPGDGAADTNLIPLFALDRIEVLKDGAASTYGSDAIAGVANFVTRRNFTGFETTADYEFVDGSDDNYRISALAGFDIGTANLMIGAGWQHRSELPTTARDFTQVPYAVNPTGFSFLSNPGLYAPVGVIPGVGATTVGLAVDGNQVNACEELGGINGGFPRAGAAPLPVCRYGYIPFANLIEEEDRYQVYGQLLADLSDTVHFTAEALYSRTELNDLGYSPSYPPVAGPRGPGSTNAFTVSANNPGYAAFLEQSFAPGTPPRLFTPVLASIVLGRPFALGGNPLDPRGAGNGAAVNDAWRVSAGLDFDLTTDLSLQVFGTYIRSARTAYSFDFVSDRYQRALNGFGGEDCTGTTPGANGCLFFNPFINSSPGNPALGLTNPAYVPGNENSQAVIDFVRQKNGAIQVEEQYIADAVFSGQTEVFGRTLGYAFGGQFRKTDFASDPINRFTDPDAYPCAIEGDRSCLDDPDDNNFPVGAFTFLGQYPQARLSQDVYAFFAEAQIEAFDGFELTGAIRYEDYGGGVGSTLNPKLSARWQVTDFLALRGSIGDTFRGPLPSDLGRGISAVAGIDALGGAFKATDQSGNPDLSPETALTYNVGALVEFGGFSASVDYWTYEFEGRFTDLPVQSIASAVAPPAADGTSNGSQFVDCSSPFAAFVVFEGNVCTQGVTVGNDISRVQVQTVNGPDVTTRGLDFGLNYRTEFGAARFSVGANATHIFEYEFSDFEFNGLTFDESYDAAGFANYNREPGTISKWRASGYANVQLEPFGLTWSTIFIGGVDDNRCRDDEPCAETPEFGPTDFGRRVESYLQNDVFATVDLRLAGLEAELQAGVENVFDREPSAARLEYSYDPFIGTAKGRTYRIGTKVRF